MDTPLLSSNGDRRAVLNWRQYLSPLQDPAVVVHLINEDLAVCVAREFQEISCSKSGLSRRWIECHQLRRPVILEEPGF